MLAHCLTLRDCRYSWERQHCLDREWIRALVTARKREILQTRVLGHTLRSSETLKGWTKK